MTVPDLVSREGADFGGIALQKFSKVSALVCLPCKTSLQRAIWEYLCLQHSTQHCLSLGPLSMVCMYEMPYWGGGYLWAISVLLRRRILVGYQCPIEEEDTCGLSVSYWGGGYLWTISVLLRRRIPTNLYRHPGKQSRPCLDPLPWCYYWLCKRLFQGIQLLSVSYWGGGYLWAISVLLRRRILVDYQCPIEEEDTCGLSVSYWGGGYLWAISVLLRRRILRAC